MTDPRYPEAENLRDADTANSAGCWLAVGALILVVGLTVVGAAWIASKVWGPHL